MTTRAGAAFAPIVFVVIGLATGMARAGEIHHDLSVRLEPASGKLSVSDAITVSDRVSVSLRLASWQHVHALSLDGTPVTIASPGARQTISLPDRGPHRISVKLEGRVPSLRHGGAGASVGISGPEGTYLPAWAGWLPDTGDDRITHRTAVSVPAPYRAITTGRLVSEGAANGWNRAVFEADRPGEPPSLFAGPYEVREMKDDDLRLRTYLHHEIADLADTYLHAAASFIRRYSREIGPYPYSGFAVVSAPLPVGLGFPGLTYVGRMVLPLPFMRGRSLAHEVLHNWWGNGVAVDYASGNWSEGLTTYMADYALAADAGANAARSMRIAWLRDYAALPRDRDTPIRAFQAKRHDASQVIGYNKTAFVFHMLRSEVGDKAFVAALRAFWMHHRFGVAGWANLRVAFEQAAGRDLGWFFDQWLTRPGAPVLAFGPIAVTRDAGGILLSLTVQQRPPYFRLTVPVRITTAGGKVARRMIVGGATTTTKFRLSAEPREVDLDPDYNLFRRLSPAETPPILRDVTLSGSAVVILAVNRPDAETAARKLAGRLMDSAVHPAIASGKALPDAPLLIVGTDRSVAAQLKHAGLPPPPRAVAEAGGTGRAWTFRREGGQPVLVISASDPVALAALERPLPHYGRRSFVVFAGSRVIRRGVWPLGASPLHRVLAR